MKLNLTLVTLFVALVYGIVRQFFPDFPISEEILLAFVLWALVRLGVEIVEPAVRRLLVRAGLKGFAKSK